MGSGDSAIYDAKGVQVRDRRCVVLVTPPSYEVSRLVQGLADCGYEYVSVGQMIRDQINKKTNYSKIILQHLEQSHKVDEKILDILLKNAALMGDFLIRFAPRDNDELAIWKKFFSKVKLQLAVAVRADPDEALSKRSAYNEKLKQYELHLKQLTDFVPKESLLEVGANQNAVALILGRLPKRN